MPWTTQVPPEDLNGLSLEASLKPLIHHTTHFTSEAYESHTSCCFFSRTDRQQHNTIRYSPGIKTQTSAKPHKSPHVQVPVEDVCVTSTGSSPRTCSTIDVYHRCYRCWSPVSDLLLLHLTLPKNTACSGSRAGQISRECKRSSRVAAKPQLKSARGQSYDRSFTLAAAAAATGSLPLETFVRSALLCSFWVNF